MRFKYPSTPHLSFSPGVSRNDRRLSSHAHFIGRDVVVTKKMDGENTSMYSDLIHAKSIDGRHHLSRDWVKGYHSSFAHLIPSGWRICGENLYARHSIAYSDLPSYFMAFSVWRGDFCLSWDDSLAFLHQLSVSTVPVLFRGVFDETVIRTLVSELDTERDEGLVVRLSDGFSYEEFALSVAKWVRFGHVQTDEHWMTGPVVPNLLRG